jgi:hypothetical protein
MIGSKHENNHREGSRSARSSSRGNAGAGGRLLLEQAEKFRALKEAIDEGMEDIEAGLLSEWNFDDFLREARTLKAK